MTLRCFCCLVALALLPIRAEPFELRVHPDTVIYAQRLDPIRHLDSVLIQTVALVNSSHRPVVVEHVTIELLHGEEVVQTHRLSSSELKLAARSTVSLRDKGLMELYAFHLRPDRLLRRDAETAPTLHLEPNTGFFLPSRYLVFAEGPDRLVVSGQARDADGELVGASKALRIVRYQNQLRYHFPLSGSWYVRTGQAPYQTHRWAACEEFALDLMRLGPEGAPHRGKGSQLDDYLGYGAEVLAAADGEVVTVADSFPDASGALRQADENRQAFLDRSFERQMALLRKNPILLAGNHVVIRHSDGEYSHYFHLRHKSPRVGVGERVRQGQVIAEVGLSGSSTTPHLHFHLSGGPDPLYSRGLPVRFWNLRQLFAETPPHPLQPGDLVTTTK